MRVPIQCGSCLHFNHSKPSFKLRHWFPSLKVVTSWIQNHDASEHNSRYWSLLSLVVRIKLQSRQYLQFPSCDCESCNGNDQKERNSKWCIYEMWSNPSKNHVQICACIYIHVHLYKYLTWPAVQHATATLHCTHSGGFGQLQSQIPHCAIPLCNNQSSLYMKLTCKTNWSI